MINEPPINNPPFREITNPTINLYVETNTRILYNLNIVINIVTNIVANIVINSINSIITIINYYLYY